MYDLSIEKWIIQSDGSKVKEITTFPDATVTYLIEFTNNGPTRATDVVMTDTYDVTRLAIDESSVIVGGHA